MLLCRLRNELWCCHEGREVNDSNNIITYCPHADVSYFPFPCATKEMGDVCTQAKLHTQWVYAFIKVYLVYLLIILSTYYLWEGTKCGMDDYWVR